jgi:hypothetical protein
MLHSCMPNTHSTTATSSSGNKTPGGPHFLDVVLMVKWYDRLVKGMFQYRLVFLKDVTLF